MIPLTLAEVAEVVAGSLHGTDGTPRVTGGVEFDSRAVGPGGLFVALPGARVDGHDYAAPAVAAGAAGVLAARPVEAPAVLAPRVLPASPPGGAAAASYVLQADRDGSGAAVVTALAALARAVATRLPELAVVGITGSSGKTSTKDMVAALLRELGPTVAPPGSFNNEIGHPWTVLRADETTRHLVLELSARGPGHIAELCAIAPPLIGVVLNVGSAHLGEFGSREAVAAAKGELVAALDDSGIAVLNADDPAVAAMASRTRARVVRFGTAADADVRAVDLTLEAGRPSFRLVSPAGEVPVTLGVHGAHQVGNALAAATVALELGAAPEQVAGTLGGYRATSRWRMEVTDRADGVTVVNDAYNANPESMRAAMSALVAIAGPDRRSWAVLGPMGELGDAGAAAHEELGALAARAGIDRLVAVGEQAAAVQRGARAQGIPADGVVLVPDADAAVAVLREGLRPGDAVLVKASRAYRLERVAAALLEGELRGGQLPAEGDTR